MAMVQLRGTRLYVMVLCVFIVCEAQNNNSSEDVLKCTPQKNEYCNIYLHTKVSIRLSVLSQSSTTVTALVQVICTGAVTDRNDEFLL